MTNQFGFVQDEDLGFVADKTAKAATEDLGFTPETKPNPALNLESAFNNEKEMIKLQKFDQVAVAQKEQAFQKFYADIAKANKLDPNPDNPQHFYDYRAYFDAIQAGQAESPQFRPEHKQFRMPDEFKLPGHPQYYTNTDPQVWTLEQTQEFLKEHPAQNPEQEAQYHAFLDAKKAQVERLQASYTDYDRYVHGQFNKQLAEKKEYPHEELLRDPEKMSDFESFMIPYVKGVAGFFTRPFGVEPFGSTFSPEEIKQAEKDNPIASAVGKAIGGLTPVAAAITIAPETLLGQIFAFAGTGAIRQIGIEKTQASLMDQEAAQKRIVKATLKSAAMAPLWYYTKAISLGGPITSILTRGAVRGAGTGGIEKVSGTSTQEAVMTGLATAALSAVFELTPYAIDKINTSVKNKNLDVMAETLVKNDQDLRNAMVQNYTAKYGQAPSEEELTKMIRAGLTIEVVKNNFSTSKIVIAADRMKRYYEPRIPEVMPSPEAGQMVLPFSEGDIVKVAGVVGKISKIVGDNAVIVSTLGKEFATQLNNIQATGLKPQEVPDDFFKKVPEDKKEYVKNLFKIENPEVIEEMINNDPHYQKALIRNKQLGQKVFAESDNPEEWPDHYKPYLDKFIKPNVLAAQGKPEAIIWMGLPGSGKTQMAKAQGLDKTHIQIDPDDAKFFIPETAQDPSVADYVHKESAYMADKLLFQKALEQNKNIIWPLVGKNPEKVKEVIQALRDAGYSIELNYNRLSTIESKKRSYKRFLEDKRFVSTEYIEGVGEYKLDKNYEALKGLADKFASWDVNTKIGEFPRGIDKGANDAEKIAAGQGTGSGRGKGGISKAGGGEGKAGEGKEVAGDIFIGPGFRVETNLVVKGKTAKEIIDFEADELGNEDIRTQANSLGLDLKNIPEKDVIWVTKNQKNAKDYGEEVDQVELGPNPLILATDGQGGYLIVKNIKEIPQNVSPEEVPSIIQEEFDKLPPEEQARYELEMDDLRKTPEGNLFIAIKQLGGIKPYVSTGAEPGTKFLAEELQSVPFYLKNVKTGSTMDSIVSELKTFGWHFDSSDDLLEEIKRQASNPVAKVDRASLQKVIREAKKNQKLQQKMLDKILPGKRRKFITTVKEAAKTAPEVAAKIESRYEPITNKETLKQAQDFVAANYNDAIELVEGPSRTSTFTNAVGIVLIDKAQAEMRWADAIRLVETLAEKNTSLGQAIQALAMYERLSPEGILQYAERQVQRARGNIKQKERITNYEKLSKGLKTQAEKDKLAEKLGIPHISETVAGELRKMSEMIRRLPSAEDWPDFLNVPPRNAYQYVMDIFKKMEDAGEIPPDIKNAFQFVFNEFKKAGIGPDTADNIPWTTETQETFKIGMGRLSRAKQIEQALLLKKIAGQIPPGLGKKIAMIQTLAQLLNPKTFVRNILGNVGFQVAENISDTFGTLLDISVSLRTGQRTTYLPSMTAQGKGLAQGMKEGTEEALLGINLKPGVTSKYTLPSNGVFDKGVLGALEKTLRISLSATDRAFYQAAFNQSTRNQCLAAGVDEPTEEMIEKANLSGLYRTFQDDNVISNTFVRLKKLLNLQKDFGLGDIVIKYPKTPANILARGIEYSPFGFIKAAFALGRPIFKQGPFNQEEFVQATSRAFTGSVFLVGLGAVLAALGIISGKRAKDRDVAATREASGIREYQVNVSALKRFLSSGMDPEMAKIREDDTLITYDWFLPGSIGLALGANMVLNPKENLVDKTLNLGDQLLQASETLQEQPLVRGLRVLTSKQNLAEGISETLQDIPASFVPSALNQIRQLIDNTARNTRDPNYFKEVYNKAAMRIPGLAGTLPEKVDTLGRTKEMYQLDSNNPFNVFLNPAFVNKYKPDPVSKMVLDIWESTGETIHFPRVAQAKIKLGSQTKEPIELTPGQYTEYQKYIGNKTDILFTILSTNKKFLAKDDDEKAKILQGYLTDINTAAKAEILGYRPKHVSHDVITIIKDIGVNKRRIDKNFEGEDLGFTPEEDLGFRPGQ